MKFTSESPGGGIFISYRRHETAPYAGRLRDRLSDRFSDEQVFMDVDSIKPGSDFADAITIAVTACEVLLALIGPQWLSITDDAGIRRLDDPHDIVRLEIEAALKRDVRVIPILVEGARMPSASELPSDLAKLARRQAVSLRHESFQQDVAQLIDLLASAVTSHAGQPAANRARSPSSDAPSFLQRILNRLGLNVWLPALLFVVGVGFLLQFRKAHVVNLSTAVAALTADPRQMSVIMLSVLAVTTVLIQVASMQALKILEGYWSASGIVGLARTLMIKRHVRKKNNTSIRLRKESERAFATARIRMLENGLHPSIVNALETRALELAPDTLTSEQHDAFAGIDWRSWSDASQLGKLDRLRKDESEYPDDWRMMPTHLGNLLRATEDQLSQQVDIEHIVSGKLRPDSAVVQRADQFQSRLKMYSHMAVLNFILAVLTPAVLLGTGVSVSLIVIVAAAFAACGYGSYSLAIASARGYCAVLQIMDRATRQP